MFSSVSPSDGTSLSPVWARISRRARLASIERSNRDVLNWVSVPQQLKCLDSLLTLRGIDGSEDSSSPTLIKATMSGDSKSSTHRKYCQDNVDKGEN